MNEIATMARPTNALVPTNITDAMQLAEFMSRARTLPKDLWDSPGDCLMVVELAMRWGMSPFAVAQGVSIINGKMMIEGKLVAAAVESSGAITGHIDYDFAGEGEARIITVTATRRGETNPRTVTVAFKDARTNNEMWKKQPDQQLVYHGARVWARRWTPAVMLGVYSREEFMGPTIDGEIANDEDTTPPPSQRDQINRDVPLKAVAANTPRGARIAERAASYDAPPEPPSDPLDPEFDWQFMKALRIALRDAKSQDEVTHIGGHRRVADSLANKATPDNIKREITAMLAEAFGRFAPPDDGTEAHEPETEDVA